MTAPLRLVIFDVDGTLVDSQAEIVAAMRIAFDRAGHAAPAPAEILSIVGLSLDVAIPRLAPNLPADLHGRMVAWYKEAYVGLRGRAGADSTAPLYPHARAVLEMLNAAPDTLLGVATGKSLKGLEKVLGGHGLLRMFVTRQVSDFHPSKPHPAMLLAALAETGVAARDAVMVGDTSFDIQMARAAGIRAIGVDWGYHSRDKLAGAAEIISDFRALPEVLEKLWMQVT